MKYYKDFPHIAIPKALEDWEDHSWHNDAMPHSELPLGDGSGIVFWVSPEDRAMREAPEYPRYIVEYQPDIDDQDELLRRILYEGEVLHEAMAAVATFLSARRR